MIINHFRPALFVLAALLAAAAHGDTTKPLPPAFLDASDKVDLWLEEPVSAADLMGHVVVRCGARTDAVSGVDTLGDDMKPTAAPSRRVRLTLSRPIKPEELAQTMSVQYGDTAARPIFARDVLSEPAYCYTKEDLGAAYTPAKTTFKVWSPVASSADVLIFQSATGDMARRIPMQRGAAGVWSAAASGNMDGAFYQYRFRSYGAQRATPDIYGHAASPDLSRSMVVDLARTDPPGWRGSAGPRLRQPTDAVVYEMHIRDFTIDPASGVPPKLRGTYLGVVAPGTHLADGSAPTGLAYLKALGVTHVHLLPFQSINPTHAGGYNWGYETDLFNVPEPRYAARPSDPVGVIRDVKMMVQGLHHAKIGVVMDVVYNHTVPASGDSSPYWATVPYYYFRTNFQGDLLNESGVGNAVDDDHPMVRKFVIDSLRYWLREYKVDGFRFDLLGMFSPETVRAISTRLHQARPDILLYGEPWTGGGPTRFGKGAQRGTGVAVFNDNFRNTLRGDLNGDQAGFALGGGASFDALRTAIEGSPDFADAPTESMNYVSIHDDMTYLDKVLKTLPGASAETQQRALKLAGAMTLLSQGAPILEGGAEMGRTKSGVANSYNRGDEINQFDWARGRQFAGVSNYYAGLIALRRAHPIFRCATQNDVHRTLAFLPESAVPAQTIAFTLDGAPNGDHWRSALVIFHGSAAAAAITLPAGPWRLAVNSDHADLEGEQPSSKTLPLAPLSAYVLYQDRVK
ncbi:pullulanase [Capsulimonas corticalis]|uniref:Pullulanase n=1 Tax=Capsulimonas corticalis TaxID=2219043 RepID=A0A402D1A2_9BACT|nr:type I pullulanase [Capsulimonas corticalis]BDI31648.1 pullulanase [Capsulimonas corticalis]